jgi:hypothetical protein
VRRGLLALLIEDSDDTREMYATLLVVEDLSSKKRVMDRKDSRKPVSTFPTS